MQTDHNATRLRVFLSYSHADKPIAKALAVALSNYAVPFWIRRKPSRLQVYRDESEARGNVLGKEIQEALQEADKLVVVCSPDAAQSEYVADELRFFAGLRGTGGIVPVLARGSPPPRPGQDPPADLAVPAQLAQLWAPDEPWMPDFRECGAGSRDVRECSDAWHHLLACLFDLTRKEVELREYRRWVLRLAATVLLIVGLVCAAARYLKQQQETDRLRQNLVDERRIKDKELRGRLRAEAVAGSLQATEHARIEAAGRDAESVRLAREALSANDIRTSLARAILAVEQAPTPAATAAILSVVKGQTGGDVAIVFEGARLAALSLGGGAIALASLDSGRIRWLCGPPAPPATLGFAGRGTWLIAGSGGRFYVWDTRTLRLWSAPSVEGQLTGQARMEHLLHNGLLASELLESSSAAPAFSSSRPGGVPTLYRLPDAALVRKFETGRGHDRVLFHPAQPLVASYRARRRELDFHDDGPATIGRERHAPLVVRHTATGDVVWTHPDPADYASGIRWRNDGLLEICEDDDRFTTVDLSDRTDPKVALHRGAMDFPVSSYLREVGRVDPRLAVSGTCDSVVRTAVPHLRDVATLRAGPNAQRYLAQRGPNQFVWVDPVRLEPTRPLDPAPCHVLYDVQFDSGGVHAALVTRCDRPGKAGTMEFPYELSVWSQDSGTQLWKVQGFYDRVRFSEDGSRLLAWMARVSPPKATVFVFDPRSGRQFGELVHPLDQMASPPSGRPLDVILEASRPERAVTSTGRSLRVWDLGTLKPLFSFPREGARSPWTIAREALSTNPPTPEVAEIAKRLLDSCSEPPPNP